MFAVCHARGGDGEKGHLARCRMRENKLNGVHDFEACVEALVAAKLTSPGHLFARAAAWAAS